jgi:hypothetical protein
MRALCAGQVVASNHTGFPVGSFVDGPLGAQEYAVSDGHGIRTVPSTIPLAASLNVLGINGLTAWFGIHNIGKPQTGETAVVTAAAGGVGSVAKSRAPTRPTAATRSLTRSGAVAAPPPHCHVCRQSPFHRRLLNGSLITSTVGQCPHSTGKPKQ